MKKALYLQAKLFVISLITTTLILFTGCNTGQKKNNPGIPTAEELSQGDDVLEELSGYPVPSSYEVTKLIYETQTAYITALANGPEKAGEYITQRDKVLNLGVYATDLCYSATYMMKQASIDYLKATKTLIDDLGISTTFNISYAERIEDNINSRDSLINIVNDSFDDTWNYLVDNKQDVLARLVVCGSWIEGVYITTHAAAAAGDNTKFLEALAKQKKSLNELVGLLEAVKDVDEVSDIYKGLSDLQTYYEEVGDIMTDEQLKIISEKIGILRESIV